MPGPGWRLATALQTQERLTHSREWQRTTGMTVTYRNSFRDRFAFAAYTMPRKPVFAIMVIGAFLFLTFEDVLPAVRSQPNPSSPVRVILFILLELVLVAMFVGFFATIVTLTLISRRNKPLNCERTLSIGEEMMVTESQYGRSETRWSLVQRLARTRTHIFLYLSADSAIIVPRRFFPDAAQWDAFYGICRRATSGAG